MKKKFELLAPAGSWEALEAAVNAGADAVYLGGTNWSARAAADNFDREGISRAVKFAHRRGVRLYVTVNTLVYDSEMRDLADELIFLNNAEVDALIVQDLGVVRLARLLVPELPLHASTQMTLTNSAAVRFARESGICRVVPARELSLSALHVASAQGVEIESFAHGALCVCYSGQCLMSSLIGGRSGNRGRCAQPCRMPYAMVDERGEKIPGPAGQYLLSPRDLSTLALLPKLLEAGVYSFKIEGRMKRPEYVAVVTDVYRRALDGCAFGNFRATSRDLERLEAIFSRGFTTAYLEKRPGRAMMSDGRPDNRGVPIGRVTGVRSGRAEIKCENELHRGDGLEFSNPKRLGTVAEKIWQKGKEVALTRAGTTCEIPVPPSVTVGATVFRTLDRKLVDEAGKFFGAKNVRTIGVDARVTASEGRPLEVVFSDGCGNVGTGDTDFPAEAAKNRPLDEATLRAQIGRLGGTDYSLGHLELHLDGSLMVPASELNKARRRGIEALDEARLASFAPPRQAVRIEKISEILDEDPAKQKNSAPRKSSELSVWTDTLEGTRAALKGGANRIIFGGDRFSTKNNSFADYELAVKIVRSAGRKIAVATPRIVSEEQLPFYEKFLTEVQRTSPDFLCVHNIGLWQLAREAGLTVPLWADMSLNIANGQSLAFWAEKGAGGATPSIELNFSRLRVLARSSPLPLECLVHGSVEMMVSEYCAAGSFLGKIDRGPCTFGCAKKVFLRDRTGAKFRLAGDAFCRMHVLNSQDLCAIDFVPRLVELGISLRIDARFYDADETLRLTREYCDAMRGKKIPAEPNTTRGHYARGAE